jgi:hypothetical protein
VHVVHCALLRLGGFGSWLLALGLLALGFWLLAGFQLQGVSMMEADLSGANLSRACLEKTLLSSANLRYSTRPCGTNPPPQPNETHRTAPKSREPCATAPKEPRRTPERGLFRGLEEPAPNATCGRTCVSIRHLT